MARAIFMSLLVSMTVVPLSAASYRLTEKNGRRQITFQSRAPVEDFEGTAEQFSGTVTIDFNRPGLGLDATVSVPVSAMSTGLAMRDEHMHSADWLNAKRYPTIRFHLSSDEQRVKAKGKNQWFVNAVGNFSLKDTTKRITVPVTIQRSGEKVIVTGRFTVKLSEYGIRGPTAMKMIGARVGEDVLVSFKLVGTAR